MKLLHYLGQMGTVYMHINLRGSNTFVPQHLLNGPEIGPIFQKVSGKRMPERMRTNDLFKPYLLT